MNELPQVTGVSALRPVHTKLQKMAAKTTLLPKTATKLPETATLTGATMLPFRATTICCRFRQQFVAWCGQAEIGLN